jgi:hypothetical protein
MSKIIAALAITLSTGIALADFQPGVCNNQPDAAAWERCRACTAAGLERYPMGNMLDVARRDRRARRCELCACTRDLRKG